MQEQIPQSQPIQPTPIAPTPVTPTPAPIANSSSKFPYVIIAFLILVIAGLVSYIVISKRSANYGNKTVTYITQPTSTPISTGNVDETLTTTDSSLQQSIDQANKDIDQITNIDKTQDSTTGF